MNKSDVLSFLNTAFAACVGDILFTDEKATKALLASADPEAITAFLSKETTARVTLVTTHGETVGVAGYIKGEMPLQPTLQLHRGATTVGVWLFEEPVTDSAGEERAIKLAQALNGPDALLDDPWPVPGVGGWVSTEVGAYYTLDQIEAGFAPLIESDSWTLNDATVYGELDDDLLARDITIAMSQHGMQTRPGHWKNMPMKFGQLVHSLTYHRVGEKDGQCILQGEVIDGERKAAAMKQTHIVMLDLDTGEHIEGIRNRIRELGLFAIIWTTFNHLKPLTEVRKDAVLRWMKKDEEPTLADVTGFLRDVRRYQPWVLEKAELLDPAHTKEGVMLRVKHAPMPKFRILLALDKPFVFATRHTNPRKAIEEWKARYAGISEMLGAAFDRSCVDPSRLMFTPRHPGGAKGWAIDVIAGKPLDIDTVTKVDPKRMKSVESGDAFDRAIAEMTGVTGDLKTPWLKRWLAVNGDAFDAEAFWRDYGEERKPRSNNPGWHFKCPNDGAHGNPDDPEDNAFFVVSSHDNLTSDGFQAKCMHDSCRELDRGQLLDLAIIEYALEEKHLDPYIANPVSANPGREIVEGSDAEEYPTLAGYPKETQEELKSMNRRYGVITIGSEVRILVEPKTRDQGPKFMRIDSWKTSMQNRKVRVLTADDETRTEFASKVWLEWPERRNFDGGICFEPSKKVSREVYNLWKEFPTKAKDGDWSLLREHILENICNGDRDHFEWLMTWFAHIFQRPGEKIGSAVVIRGKKGTGKSKLFDWVRRAMGTHAIKVSQPGHVTGNFNAHQRGVILMVCEEAFWAGSSAAGGVIKDLITSDTMMLEQKGVDAIQTSNYARLAFISNEDWVVPAGLDDERRFFVLECGDKRQRDTIYFSALDEQMESGGLQAMVKEFEEWIPPGGDWNILRNPPQTEALQEQAFETMNTWDRFFVQMIEDCGVAPSSHPDIMGIELSENDPNFIHIKSLRAHLQKFTSNMGTSAKIKITGHNFLLKCAQQWLLADTKSISRREGTTVDKYYVCPSLKEIRDHVNEQYGLNLEPPEIVDSFDNVVPFRRSAE